jgi:hypothetical protein
LWQYEDEEFEQFEKGDVDNGGDRDHFDEKYERSDPKKGNEKREERGEMVIVEIS